MNEVWCKLLYQISVQGVMIKKQQISAICCWYFHLQHWRVWSIIGVQFMLFVFCVCITVRLFWTTADFETFVLNRYMFICISNPQVMRKKLNWKLKFEPLAYIYRFYERTLGEVFWVTLEVHNNIYLQGWRKGGGG